ncbi:MAG: hypothetical protein RLZZ505_3045 [Verrucomicrobiota bacterium]|jgi:hypothetical protein
MMKFQILASVILIAIGFSIGWVAKPAPDESTPLVAANIPSNESARITPRSPVEQLPRGKRAIRRTETAEHLTDILTPEQMLEAKEMQTTMGKQMIQRHREKFEAQIARLTENLSLTELQKSDLTAWLDKHYETLGNIDFTDPAGFEKLVEDSKLLNNEALQDQLAGMLTPDQKKTFAGNQERERLSKVDAIALKDLSKLQGIIHFEEGQRDKVYQLLFESAEQSVTAESQVPNISSIMNEGMDIETDPYGLGIQQVMSETMENPTEPGSGFDQKSIAKNLRQIIADRIDSKIEKLRHILNDKQLEAYRKELETNGSGIYGPMLDSMEAAEAGGDSRIELPTN